MIGTEVSRSAGLVRVLAAAGTVALACVAPLHAQEQEPAPAAADTAAVAEGMAGETAAMAEEAATTPPQGPRPQACVDCHLGLEDEELAAPARTYATDVHAERGFTCLSCHGGPLAGEQGTLDPSEGFLAAPSRQREPELCGRCHSDAAFMRNYDPSIRVDQVSEYYTSVHGRQLRDANDPDVATCTSCHPAHDIRPPTDPESSVYALTVAATCAECHADPDVMADHEIPTDQLEEYRESVHGQLIFEEGDVTAPTCNDCHGNHGAAPPGVESVRRVCGQCHTLMADLFFTESGHVEIFEERDLPGCATCHDNHAIEPTEEANLAARTRTVCRTCHEPGAELGDEFLAMQALIDSLVEQRERAEEILDEAENRGMEVSQAVFELSDANNALTKARTAIHSFHVGPVAEEVEAGLEVTSRAVDRGEEALDEHRFRRVGLAASSFIILTLIVGLLAKIRQVDRHQTVDLSSGNSEG